MNFWNYEKIDVFLPGPPGVYFFQLCITKHAPEIQLKVSDMSVRPLWRDTKVKAVLVAMGFHQIGPLLNFNNIPSNWYVKRLTPTLIYSMKTQWHNILSPHIFIAQRWPYIIQYKFWIKLFLIHLFIGNCWMLGFSCSSLCHPTRALPSSTS